MTPTGSQGLPALAVALSAVIWGLWWLPLRWLAERGLPGDWASLAVYSVATALLVPFAWPRRRQLRAGGPALLLTGALFGVMLVLWNHAVLVGEVVRVVLLFYLAPVWATLLAVTVLRVRVGPWRGASVLLGLAGAAVILGFEHGPPVPRSAGDWLGLGSGVLFALAATLARRTEAVAGFDKTFVSFAAAALAALALVAAEPPAGPTGREMLAALPLAAATAVIWMLPATWLVFWGATRLEPGRVSILLLLEVVAASASASLLTDEPFGWREAGGGVLILLAGLVEASPELRPRAP
ncbi:MAG: DMT family transporter [Kiloniellaceae bacterium]